LLAIIEILLGLSALYSGGAYLWVYAAALRNRASLTPETADAIERSTFHLGLCFILALGFLGLIAGGR
jgi:hypothetical protein